MDVGSTISLFKVYSWHWHRKVKLFVTEMFTVSSLPSQPSSGSSVLIVTDLSEHSSGYPETIHPHRGLGFLKISI